MPQLFLILLLLSCLHYISCHSRGPWYPKYHVVPPYGWTNDPNGLIHHNGFYHAFYQYKPEYPYGSELLHWGHVRSTDMLNWEHLPIALQPSLEEDIDGIYSGSAVDLNGRLVLIYTGVSENSTRQRQLAASAEEFCDETFEKWGVIIDKEGSEVDFRDPKAWWQDGSWYVVIGSKTNDNRGEALLFSSPNFSKWTFEGVLAEADQRLGYMWECPDFFTLNGKQILLINPQGMKQEGFDFANLFQTGYFVGKWKPGSNYAIETEFKEVDHGHDFYASQTFLAPDGRRILIGWMGMWESEFPESWYGWAAMLTLPRELTLNEAGKIESRPIREIQDVRVKKLEKDNISVKGYLSADYREGIKHNEIVIQFNLSSTTSNKFGIAIKDCSDPTSEEGVIVYADIHWRRIFLERYYPEYKINQTFRSVEFDVTLDTLTLDVFVDGSSIEVFVNDGEAVMTSRIYPEDDQRNLLIFESGEGDHAYVNKYEIYEM